MPPPAPPAAPGPAASHERFAVHRRAHGQLRPIRSLAREPAAAQRNPRRCPSTRRRRPSSQREPEPRSPAARVPRSPGRPPMPPRVPPRVPGRVAEATSGSQSTGALTANATYTLPVREPAAARLIGDGDRESAHRHCQLDCQPKHGASGVPPTLTWSSTNATSCTASGAWSGSKPTERLAVHRRAHGQSTYTLILHWSRRQRSAIRDRDGP